MPVLNLTYAPDPIFKQKALEVEKVEDVAQLVQDMLDTMYFEKAVGMGANMVGELKRVAVVDIMPHGEHQPHVLINPEITWHSEETQTNEEASICYPYIAAEITRPDSIVVRYLDETGMDRELEAQGFLAAVIQHEVDYLDGKVFLDYLSRTKRDNLLRKMQKHMKLMPPGEHGNHCQTGCC